MPEDPRIPVPAAPESQRAVCQALAERLGVLAPGALLSDELKRSRAWPGKAATEGESRHEALPVQVEYATPVRLRRTMNTDDRTGFEYRGWQVHIEPTGSGDTCSLHADLYYQGKYKCRVSLSPAGMDPSCACWALDSRACDFIDEWTMRPHSGDTVFQEL
jgi:hypothetical protein